MATTSATTWSHSNQYHSAAACEHCDGVIRHEPWCITGNAEVYYAYDVVLHADRLTVGDHIILHGLGVTWSECTGNCKRRS